MKKQKNDIVEKLNKKIEENKKNIKIKEENLKNETENKKDSVKSKKDTKKNEWLKNKAVKRVLEFVETIIYIISIIVVIFANLYGPIYIQMIPLLFILGIVGKFIYNRPVTTTVFGILVAICAVYVTGIKSIEQNILISFCMGLYIAFGEICGFFIQKSYCYIKKKTKRKSKKAIFSYLILITTFIVSLGMYNYTNSNYFELNKTNKRLNEYLASNYSDKKFDIVNIKYNFLGEKSFIFELKEKDKERVYKFIVSINEKFEIEDGIVKYENANKEKNVNERLLNYLKENNLKEKYKDVKIGVMLNEVDNFDFEIIKEEENITEDNTLDFSKIVASVIADVKEFEYFKEFEQIIISLRCTSDSSKNLTSYLYIDRYVNNNTLEVTKDYEYIKKSLNVEYID